MNPFRRRQPVSASAKAREAMGLSSDVIALGEVAVGQALEVIDPKPSSASVPSNPIGHLRFAERMVAQTAADEARVLAAIEEENANHAAAVEAEREHHAATIASLESELADARRTGAFYATAPEHLTPAHEAIERPAPRKRRRANKVQSAEVAANE